MSWMWCQKGVVPYCAQEQRVLGTGRVIVGDRLEYTGGVCAVLGMAFSGSARVYGRA
jgi:hypothetical protein